MARKTFLNYLQSDFATGNTLRCVPIRGPQRQSLRWHECGNCDACAHSNNKQGSFVQASCLKIQNQVITSHYHLYQPNRIRITVKNIYPNRFLSESNPAAGPSVPKVHNGPGVTVGRMKQWPNFWFMLTVNSPARLAEIMRSRSYFLYQIVRHYQNIQGPVANRTLPAAAPL